ncbi:D-alanyl-D-alanine carboxypeptidase (penicillin-binding protein 5/6) [Propionispira arboris]|uniref:serine-type D-Ala-D-Ala carboxypeptidase n=2 Tax=Propionispira arboris TaxID=84035 RepID=A0A1H7BHQ8_9FIRM|nr:D-alanyl-D-alanine carboxypeptidase (penicillin-binding protein 5/6) [Propionispira arboris]
MRFLQGICLISIFCFSMIATVFAEDNPQALDDMTATSMILIEASTGKVIYEKNAESRQYPASTTKMMTLLLAIENANLDDTITVDAQAAAVEGSSMHLETDDQLKLKDLVTGMMLASGNDATVAVADYLAGSVQDYAEYMTEKAQAIGATNTHFANSSGLPNSDHYSTAHDLARIAAYGYKNPIFRQIVGTKEKEIQWQFPSAKKIKFENTNELLGVYPGANGMKTGYTQAAGECLVASAERNGVNLIAVVMHAADNERFIEAAKLLDYGFKNVKMVKAFAKDEVVQNIRVHGGKIYQLTARPKADILYPISGDDSSRFSIQIKPDRYVKAPVQKDTVVGYVSILYDGQEVNRIDLLADESAPAGFNLFSFFGELYDGIFSLLGFA